MQGRSQKQRGVSMLVGAYLGSPCIYVFVCSCADVPLNDSSSKGLCVCELDVFTRDRQLPTLWFTPLPGLLSVPKHFTKVWGRGASRPSSSPHSLPPPGLHIWSSASIQLSTSPTQSQFHPWSSDLFMEPTQVPLPPGSFASHGAGIVPYPEFCPSS